MISSTGSKNFYSKNRETCVTDRPYVVLSVAASIDGYIDDTTDQRLLLSNDEDFDRVDEVRAGVDAILVGANTIRQDNPRLLVRSLQRRVHRTSSGLTESPSRSRSPPPATSTPRPNSSPPARSRRSSTPPSSPRRLSRSDQPPPSWTPEIPSTSASSSMT